MVVISVILFCLAGIAALMGWIPLSFGSPVAAEVREISPLTEGGAVVRARCGNCGVIESTWVVDASGNSDMFDSVGGAVVCGALGNHVGGGRGKDLLPVVGAMGAGSRARSCKRYETTVRFDDGSIRVFGEINPRWQTGDRVKVMNGVIRLRG